MNKDFKDLEIERLRKENEELKNKLYQERKDSSEKIKRTIQEQCDHRWGSENWINSCFYTCTCMKCGKVETFYERD